MTVEMSGCSALGAPTACMMHPLPVKRTQGPLGSSGFPARAADGRDLAPLSLVAASHGGLRCGGGSEYIKSTNASQQLLFRFIDVAFTSNLAHKPPAVIRRPLQSLFHGAVESSCPSRRACAVCKKQAALWLREDFEVCRESKRPQNFSETETKHAPFSVRRSIH